MDNITVIVEDYPQEITVQVVTTGITVDQANQIVTNTQKVSDINHVTLELFNVDNTSDLDKPISTATNQALNTEEQARIDADNLLQSNIDSEATTRSSNDNTLQSNIDDLDIRVSLNDVKVGITPTQASDIVTNNAKVGYTDALVSANTDVVANTAKVGITSSQANEIIANTAKVGITNQQANEIIANNAKVGYTEALVSANASVVANTAKVGITPTQASDIVTNNSKVGITTQQTNDIITNNAKVGYTDALVSANSDVVANTAKTGITNQQASDIITNNGKVGITTTQANDIITNNAKVGITTQQASDITTNNAKVSDINHVEIELPNVDNTSDLNKPISVATQSALDLKVNKTQDEINTQNIFKAVSFAMDFSDRVIADSGILESRECVMNEYLKINI